MKKRFRVVLGLLTAIGIGASSITAMASDVPGRWEMEYGPCLNPYMTREAEINFGDTGTDITEEDGRKAVGLGKGEYIKFDDVKFDQGMKKIEITAKTYAPTAIVVRRDREDGRVLAKFKIKDTQGKYEKFSVETDDIAEKNKIFFVCTVGDCAIDSWRAITKEEVEKAEQTVTEVPEATEEPAVTEEPEVTEEPAVTEEPENTENPEQPENVDPYVENEAEDLTNAGAFQEGRITYAFISERRVLVAENVNFEQGVSSISLKTRTRYDGATIDIYVDNPEGTPIARTLASKYDFRTSCAYVKSNISGVHNVYFVANEDIDFDVWTAMPSVEYFK